MVSVKIHQISITINSDVQLLNKVITVFKKSDQLLDRVILVVDSETIEADVERAEIYTRRDWVVKTPRRLLF